MPAQHGAKAILFITDPNNHPDEADTVGKATGDLEFRDLSILAMHVTREAVMSLFTSPARTWRTVQQAIDQGRKPQSFEFTNSKIRVSADIKPIRKTVRNVLASVRRLGPSAPKRVGCDRRDTTITLGSAIATIRMSQADVGKIHHGADDNASGTAGVLELARLIARQQASVQAVGTVHDLRRRRAGIVRVKPFRESIRQCPFLRSPP